MEEKFNYDSIPVEFCSRATCCSLAIIEETEVDEDGKEYKSIFCKTCGGTKISKDYLSQWEVFYVTAHGKKFLDE